MLTRLAGKHRESLADLVSRTREFTEEEAAVALELIDLGIGGSRDYRFWIDVAPLTTMAGPIGEGRVRGYLCFGKTPMTQATYDLYWIAVEPDEKKTGIGRGLVRKMEEEIASEGARLVRVETSGLDAYAPTRAFYEHLGYEVIARIRDFYWTGNDLIMFGRYFT